MKTNPPTQHPFVRFQSSPLWVHHLLHSPGVFFVFGFVVTLYVYTKSLNFNCHYRHFFNFHIVRDVATDQQRFSVGCCDDVVQQQQHRHRQTDRRERERNKKININKYFLFTSVPHVEHKFFLFYFIGLSWRPSSSSTPNRSPRPSGIIRPFIFLFFLLVLFFFPSHHLPIFFLYKNVYAEHPPLFSFFSRAPFVRQRYKHGPDPD